MRYSSAAKEILPIRFFVEGRAQVGWPILAHGDVLGDPAVVRFRPALASVSQDCRGFTVVSPGMSGHTTVGKRAPMLGKWPNPNKLSGKLAPGGGLWIRRVLVRAQEGQWPVREHRPFFYGLVLQRLRRFRIEP